MTTFYDENSPKGPVPADSEPGVIGMRAAVLSGPMPGAQSWLPGYYTPDGRRAAFATALSTSPATAFFTHEPPPKFADESTLSAITFQPVTGMEKHVSDMNAGYNPFSTKEPKTRANDHTPTNVLADRLANLPPTPLGSSDDAMLALLMDA